MPRTLLVLATPVALLACGWAMFYVLKQPPTGSPCESGTVAGVEAYRDGLGTYATFSAAVIGGMIAFLSRGRWTRYALAVCAWLVGLYNVEHDAFEPHATIGFFLTYFGGEVVLLVSALTAVASRRPHHALLVYLWTTLLVVLPGAAGFPASEGVPFLCLD